MGLMNDCRSLKDSLLLYLSTSLEVSAYENRQCIVTLPIQTLDHRFIDVCVESKIGDAIMVHDGGKATSELFSQGIHLTNTREAVLKAIAHRYGATFADGTFSIFCKANRNEVEGAIFAIGQCASLAMYDVLKHSPLIEDESMSILVKRAVEDWHPEGFELKYRVPVKTPTRGVDHFFDVVMFPRQDTKTRTTVAVTALTLGYPPQVQADRYGFLALDLRGTMFEKWARLAVIPKIERWPEPALRQIRALSTQTLEVREGDEQRVKDELPNFMKELSLAA